MNLLSLGFPQPVTQEVTSFPLGAHWKVPRTSRLVPTTQVWQGGK